MSRFTNSKISNLKFDLFLLLNINSHLMNIPLLDDFCLIIL